MDRGTEQVTIEGHADPHGSSGPFATDWDLASARATTVLKYFVDRGLEPKRISAVSYGSARSTDATTAAQQEHNRRVDIVLHTRTATTAATTTASAATSTTTMSSTAATPAPTTTAVAAGK
jgi:chemotaxis protein MotB